MGSLTIIGVFRVLTKQLSYEISWRLLWILCLFTSAAQAQTTAEVQKLLDNMHFQRLLTGEDENEKRGIGVVFSIVQDETGFLWFGGDSGLVRYDAHTFKFYDADPNNPRALASTWINDLLVDRNGVLWLATGSGLSRYNRETDDFTTLHPQLQTACRYCRIL